MRSKEYRMNRHITPQRVKVNPSRTTGDLNEKIKFNELKAAKELKINGKSYHIELKEGKSDVL